MVVGHWEPLKILRPTPLDEVVVMYLFVPHPTNADVLNVDVFLNVCLETTVGYPTAFKSAMVLNCPRTDSPREGAITRTFHSFEEMFRYEEAPVEPGAAIMPHFMFCASSFIGAKRVAFANESGVSIDAANNAIDGFSALFSNANNEYVRTLIAGDLTR